TRNKVIAEIDRRHRARQSLRSKSVPNRLYLAGVRCFGSWKNAIEKAGLCYEEIAGVRRLSRNEVIQMIRQLLREGVSLNATFIKEHYSSLHGAAIKKHFPSSWAKALQAAGLDPGEHKKPRGKWDKKK